MNVLNYKSFNESLLSWYYEVRRDLPWRQTNDPYKIWLSEVMLQQTQVKTVIPYYNRFIDKYPTLDSIADESSENLLKEWEGLGYYNRIRNFHEAVKEVKSSYHSKVPNTPNEFLKLKGVGPYIGGAVQSIAFNHRVAAVDGNVLRVMTRLTEDDRDISKQKTITSIKEHIETFMPIFAGDFNQAMMELGATVCTPRIPKCVTCPVQSHCESFKNNTVNQYPFKKKSKAKKEFYYNIYLILNDNNEVYLYKETEDLLQGMYKFPKYDIDTSIENIEAKLNLTLSSLTEPIGEEKHVFTHKVLYMNIYVVYTKDKNDHFVPLSSVRDLPMSVAMQKVYKYIDETI